MKRNVCRSVLSMTLALVICLSIPLTAFAEEVSGTVEVETTKGSTESVDVTITIETTPTADGGTNVQTTAASGVVFTENGLLVSYQGSSNMTTDADGFTTGTAESSYSVGTVNNVYGASGGSSVEQSRVTPNVTVDVPLTEGASDTAYGDSVGTETGNGSTTVVSQGSATAVNTGMTTDILDAEDQEYGYGSDLEYVSSEVAPSSSNDLVKETVSAAPENYLPEDGEGYDYVYAGTGNTSQFRPAIVFTEALTEEEILEFSDPYIPLKYLRYFPTDLAVKDENGNYVTDADGYLLDAQGNKILKEEKIVVGPDGETYYLHRIDNLGTGHNVEGWYQDGQWLEELNGDKYGVVYSSSQQFVLVDRQTGEIITAYCADLSTYTQDGYGYIMENLEDADYYTEEQAGMIRSIALNGYWGTVGTQLDAEGREVPKTGSLDAMKEMLRNALDAEGNRIFTDEEIDNSLTDGVALTATQMAIWSCSNRMEGVRFVNSHYVDTPEKTETSVTGTGGNIPTDKEDETLLMFKIYEYLMALEPTDAGSSSSGTVITAENMLKDMSITVIEKAEDHINNQDADNHNDAYVTDLSFTLVVTPSTENGDDMIVKIVSNGQILKEARIAGNAAEGETLETLTCDENGNYVIHGITLTEGNQEFNITLEGIQNLEQGVYLYSSEVRNVDGEEISSQTMVGLAGGEHAVNVSMTVSFELDVNDAVVATETVWRNEWHRPYNPEPIDEEPEPEDPENPDEEVILDEDVALADAPKTGDSSDLLVIFAAVSAFGLIVLSLPRKKEEV